MNINLSVRLSIFCFLGLAASYDDVFGSKKKYEELVEAVAKTGAKVDQNSFRNLDELFEQCLRKRGISKPKDIASEKAALRKLAHELQVTDPNVIRILDDLPSGQQRKLAAVFMDGADVVKKGVPDIRARGNLLKADGAADILLGSSRHGRNFASEASFLRRAFDEGAIKSVKGKRAGTFADFARNMAMPNGSSYWKFYASDVFKKHWGKLASAGLLSWFIADPDFFIDAVGNLTERGFRAIRDLLGEAIAAAFLGFFSPEPGKTFEYLAGLLALTGIVFLWLAWKFRWLFFAKKQEALK